VFRHKAILKSPHGLAVDPNVSMPLRMVLEPPHRERLVKLLIAAGVCFALVVVAGLVIWLWGYPTQRNNPGFWHVTLVSLLFWLSVTQGMLALSCLLRVTHASWRYSLNRVLDISSLFGVWVPFLLPLLVLSRQRIYSLGSSDAIDTIWRLSGPIAWDALAVGTAYLAGWALLYLTSLPDFAVLRDRAAVDSKEQWFYGVLAKNWVGSASQWKALRRAEGVLVVGIILAFVASQTVLGWDFQLAAARDWDSSIFAPLYTVGSLLGGTALSSLIITVVNRSMQWRGPFGIRQYDNLGRVMIALGLVWFYFRWCDYLTAWYGRLPSEWAIQNNRVTAFPILAAVMTVGCFAVPVFGNMIRRFRTTAAGSTVISIFVLIGIAVQRYLDTVPTFAPNYPLSALKPTIPTMIIFASLSAMFVLTYLFAAKYIPVLSWWGVGKDLTRTAERKFGNGTVTVMVEDPPIWET
jgi:hypothetical protein